MMRTTIFCTFFIYGTFFGQEYCFRNVYTKPTMISEQCMQKIKALNRMDKALGAYLKGSFRAYRKKATPEFRPSTHLKKLVNDPELPIDRSVKSDFISATFCLANILTPHNCKIIDSFFEMTLKETKNATLTCNLTHKKIVVLLLRPQFKSFKHILAVQDAQKTSHKKVYRNQA